MPGCTQELSSCQSLETHIVRSCRRQEYQALQDYLTSNSKQYCIPCNRIWSRGDNCPSCRDLPNEDPVFAPTNIAPNIALVPLPEAPPILAEAEQEAANFIQGYDMEMLITRVLKAQVKTIQYPPKRLRNLIKRAYSKCLQDICDSPLALELHARKFAFHKFILAHRGTKDETPQTQRDFISKRLCDWETLPIANIIDIICTHPIAPLSRRQRRKPTVEWAQPDFNIANCKRYMRLGRMKDAVNSLDSAGVHAPCDDIIRQLKEKHPESEELLPPATNALQNRAIHLERKHLEASIQGFPRGSACGPSGERVEFLTSLLRGPDEDTFWSLLCAFGNKMVSGSFPASISAYYGAAKLLPLKKKDGGVRPIAVGEIWRRIVGKSCAHLVKVKMSQLLRPHQLGVGISTGAEAIVHATAAITEKNAASPNLTTLQVDFKNAFNLVSRSKLLEQVAIHCPEISSYVEWLYSVNAKLFIPKSDRILLSSTGVQQGDPLGPLLFSLVLNVLITRIKEAVPELILNAWYLDDGVLIGQTDAIKKAYDLIVQEGPALGLHLNPAKCVLFWPNAVAEWSDFPQSLVRTTDGMVVLGSPIGSDAFIRTHVRAKVEQISNLMRTVKDLQDPQEELLLLRACVGFPKLVFTVRTTPSQTISNELNDFECKVGEMIHHILGTPLTAVQRELWSLPTSMAGFGIPIISAQANGAFLASVTSTLPLQRGLGCNSVRRALEASYDHVSTFFTLPELDINNFSSVSQHNIKAAQDIITRNRIFEAAEERTKALINGRTSNYANSWLFCPPLEYEDYRINPHTFQCLLKYHSGIPILSAAKRCPECHTEMDVFGDHAIACSVTNERIMKHNAMTRVLHQLAIKAGYSARVELAHGEHDRMGDVVITGFRNGRDLWIDTAITSTLCPTYRRGGAANPLSAAENRFQHKLNRYEEERRDIQFLPVIFETLGGVAVKSAHFLKDLADAVAMNSFEGGKQSLQYIKSKLSMTLQKANGHMIASRCLSYTPI